MRSITILFVWALALAALVFAGDRGPPFDADSIHYHGYALVETWIGRTAVNVGGLTGTNLYNAWVAAVGQDCPGKKGDNIQYNCGFQGAWHRIPTNYVKDIKSGATGFAYLEYWAEGVWESEGHRSILIETVADILDSMTADNINSWSCYNVPGQDHQFCNIGDSIRVNLLSKEPAGGKGGNYMHVWFYGPNVYQGFQCCPTRFKADRAMDWLKTKYDGIYWNQRSFSRDTKCLIWGMETCEGCGHKCDYCDNKCHDVCPKGKC